MSRKLNVDIVQALDFRLELRYAFLRAIKLSELRTYPESLKTPWVEMKAILEPIAKSHSLGKPCPQFFSAKLQRRLASTMPPRPIVQLSFEEAISHFRRLAVDGLEVADVLKYTDSQSLLVCRCALLKFSRGNVTPGSQLPRTLSLPFKQRSHNLWSTYEHSCKILSSRIWSFLAR